MTLKVDGTNGVLQAYDYQVLTTGFSYTFASGTQTLVINPAGTLATGTITMPASPVDGMTITFSSTKEISTLTVNGNTGQSITGTPGVLPANTTMAFVYRLANTTWYPMQTAPVGVFCRAWVNVNGSGATSIRASYNVSSVTYSGTGYYTINMTNALSDANYTVVGSSRPASTSYATTTVVLNRNGSSGNTSPTTSSFSVATPIQGVSNASDSDYVCVAVFR